jgi:hypothetical protein
VTAGNSLYEPLGTAYACISWEKLIRDELFRVTVRVRWDRDHGMVTVVCSDAQHSDMVRLGVTVVLVQLMSYAGMMVTPVQLMLVQAGNSLHELL